MSVWLRTEQIHWKWIVNDRKCDFDSNPERFPEDQDAFMAWNSQRRVNIKLNQTEKFRQALLKLFLVHKVLY